MFVLFVAVVGRDCVIGWVCGRWIEGFEGAFVGLWAGEWDGGGVGYICGMVGQRECGGRALLMGLWAGRKGWLDWNEVPV